MGLISDGDSQNGARRRARHGHDGRDNYGRDNYGRGLLAGDNSRADGYGYGGLLTGGPSYGHAGGGEVRAGYGEDRTEGLGRDRLAGYDRGRRGGGRARRSRFARRGRRRRGNVSVPVVSVVAVLASIAVVAAAAGANKLLTARSAASAAPATNMNCTLIVPQNPLSAQGLATPYQLTATDPASGPCNEANANQTAFVQGAVFDPATGQISVYDPLVVDAGTQPAAAPVVPTLPAGAVVALWFGFNGNTLSLAGPDQVPATPSQGATASASASAAPTSSAPTSSAPTSSATASQTASASPTASGSASASGSPAATASPTSSASPAASATGGAAPALGSQGTGSPSTPATATPAAPGTATASAAAVVRPAGPAPATRPEAVTEAEGAAPLSPDSSTDAQYNVTLTRLAQRGAGGTPGSSDAGTGSSSSPAAASASPSGSAAGSGSASPAAPSTVLASPSTSTGAGGTASAPASAPATSAGDTPAASGNPDAILQQANCVAGENIGGQFSAFTQVGACNAVAFFQAANSAISAGKLRVPAPGVGTDGMNCLTTRSFALIDQDQSDNVTTEYLSEGNGQTAQDTAANRQAMTGAATLVNGSDNGLLDLFVDPALGCSPWEVPNLADGGAPAPALPLDELQAARYAGNRGNPAALVPLNDPMTLDNNGQFSTDKTNTYRSLVDMPPLPAGEAPRAYCADMERIQSSRLQQDVNLLTRNAGPAPDAADNLFTFLAMRLQQSFTNLNCGSFGLRNDVSTSVDGNGVVVQACFIRPVAPVTAGPGNPMARTRLCPATTAPSSPGATSSPGAAASPSATPTATSSAPPQRRHLRHHHWWW